jgi:hypothetical protein
MKRADQVISLILIGVCAYIFYETSFYPEPIVPEAPGAAYFPRGLAAALILLAAFLFIQGWLPGKGAQKEEAKMQWPAVWKMGLTLLLSAGFIASFEILDTFILIPLLLAPIMVIMGERKIRSIIAVPLMFDLFIYVVFYRLFHVQIPTFYF